MASNWISDISYDERGRPYRTYLMDGPNYARGDRTYVSPAEVSPSNTQDPRLLSWAQGNAAPSGGLVHGRGTWDSRTGQWKQGLNGGNLLSIGVGGLFAAPLLAPALAGLGGGGSGAAAASGAGAGAGSGGAGGGMFAGLRLGDLIKGGTDLTGLLLGNLATNKGNARSAQAAEDALAFARQQYGEQNALEQARYDATEARRAPYRQASNQSLIALKQLLGLGR